MPTIVNRSDESLHIPGLPAWAPGEERLVSDDAAAWLTRHVALATPADAAAEPAPEPGAAAPSASVDLGEFVVPAMPAEGTV